MLKPTFGVAISYQTDGSAHGSVYLRNRARGGGAGELLDFAAAAFHRRQVRRIRRQNPELCPALLDGSASTGSTVCTQPVDNDHIAGLHSRSDPVADVRLEDGAVHGPLEGHRFYGAAEIQPDDERDLRVGVTRHPAVRPTPATRTTVPPRHPAMQTELVEEGDVACAYSSCSPPELSAALADGGPILLARSKRFFFS
ncbi:hypothetical protein WMF22_12485 [Sorangium sp. So ce204]